MERMPGCRVIASQSFGKKYGLVLAEINEIYCANHVFGSSPVPGTFPSLFRHFQVEMFNRSWDRWSFRSFNHKRPDRKDPVLFGLLIFFVIRAKRICRYQN